MREDTTAANPAPERYVWLANHPDMSLKLAVHRDDCSKAWVAELSVAWSGAVSIERSQPPKDIAIEAARRVLARAARDLLPVLPEIEQE
jgi:hypothetical protein